MLWCRTGAHFLSWKLAACWYLMIDGEVVSVIMYDLIGWAFVSVRLQKCKISKFKFGNPRIIYEIPWEFVRNHDWFLTFRSVIYIHYGKKAVDILCIEPLIIRAFSSTNILSSATLCCFGIAWFYIQQRNLISKIAATYFKFWLYFGTQFSN